MNLSIALVTVAGSGLLIAANQKNLPAQLTNHHKAVSEAQSASLKLTVQQVPGSPEEWVVLYAKPNMFRIESPAELWVCDGKTVTILDKSKNTYKVSDVVDAWHYSQMPQIWGWSNFFQNDIAKVYDKAQVGAKRKVRGVEVTEVATALADGNNAATIYVDNKTSLAYGFSLKLGNAEWLVFAQESKLGHDALAADQFAFVAPAGATLAVEEPKVADWATVSAIFNKSCMPCHGQAVLGGFDVRTYEEVAHHDSIISGNSAESNMIGYLKGTKSPKMPKNRAPLSPEQIKVIADWIDGGLKK